MLDVPLPFHQEPRSEPLKAWRVSKALGCAPGFGSSPTSASDLQALLPQGERIEDMHHARVSALKADENR